MWRTQTWRKAERERESDAVQLDRLEPPLHYCLHPTQNYREDLKL